MGSHLRFGFSAALATTVALGCLFVPPAEASVLPQIKQAETRRTTAMKEHRPIGPVLSKHYIQIDPDRRIAVKGERERRQIRFARWVAGLSGDRAMIHAEAGHPPHRWFESAAGVRTEFWNYPETNITYGFEGDRLVSRRPR